MADADNRFIARLKLMTPLGIAELLALERLLQDRREFRAGQDIVKAGDRPDQLHIMLSGWACRYKLLGGGGRQIVALLLPGDPCDLDGVLVGRQDTSVATLTSVIVAVVSRDALLSVGRAHPRLADLLLWLTTLDNALMSERIASMGRRSARERVAHLFCELFVRLSSVGLQTSNAFALPFTQEVIGDTLGLTSVHVNRVLQALRKDGLIDLREHMLTVKDWPGLKAVAGFDPNYLHLSGMRAAPTSQEG
ncbi:Crp/Fnr family transcriptional regulator [Sphingomonas sp. ID0503]|uniref:Crp/Fnr family transcriptional regulator n=1 Tax=Sphingomonas sp. ID0503 TaxID=3399691 RepID=UPI003AFADD2C